MQQILRLREKGEKQEMEQFIKIITKRQEDNPQHHHYFDCFDDIGYCSYIQDGSCRFCSKNKSKTDYEIYKECILHIK